MAELHPPPSTIARRQFLAATAGTTSLLVAAVAPRAWAAPSRRLDDPFTLGVASGDPTPTGVVGLVRMRATGWSPRISGSPSACCLPRTDNGRS